MTPSARRPVLLLLVVGAVVVAGAHVPNVPDARALGAPLTGTPGRNNAITDVAGWRWVTPP